MPKPFSTWWTAIALFKVLALALALSPALLVLPNRALAVDTERMNEGLTAGQTAGATIQEKYGNQASLRLNILNPMTSSAAPLETVDGSVAFTGQLSFPSSEKFLEVFMQPGPTGDLSTVIVSEDLDFDGSIDYSYQVPDPVSGVCGNGIIACTPGTWTDCRYYLWTADPPGRVTLAEASPDNLGGCYCINNDCGRDLVWNNTQAILQDLGGGVVGAMQQANAGFTLSKVSLEQTTIAYYGQNTSMPVTAGEAASGGAAAPVQTEFFTQPWSISNATQELALAQTGDAESLYTLITHLSKNQEQNSCQIERRITLNQLTLDDILLDLGGGEGGFSLREDEATGQRYVLWVVGRYTAVSWMPDRQIVDQTRRLYIKEPQLIDKVILSEVRSDDSIVVFIDGVPLFSQPAGCRYDGSGCSRTAGNLVSHPNREVTDLFRKAGELEGKARVFVGNDGEGYAVFKIYFSGFCKAREDLRNDCAAFENREDCTLREETVDEVRTYHLGNPTRLAPLPSERTLSQGDCTQTLTFDWWEKTRTYICSATSYDFSDVKTRYGTVVESLGEAETTGSYRDQLQGEEGWVAGDGTIELMDLPEQDECETACKTRRPTRDTRAVLTGHSGQLKTNTDSYDILYHACINGRCPMEEDEEILKDCQCLNEFAEAASIMQMLRLAGQDTLCSDGVAK